ncbi:MAG TPA: hypothetical protein PLR32_04340 [candidate division Zixibacteria bacterium]|nr:hypothetical protein [candidate division Zixibacteria bacterium]MDD4917081.1 hypothetical protein [candidate division Zixibacteria bacterium]MDM7972937.1 hypothetical protein [candidate division Zixibacteria bacterium]HOD65307.1 hypothetical protein [candidate division Zixibacteria bacterium]HOZ08567.1 hypothetical protein [candidate division Zixibacteria bacterium]
MRSHRSLFLSGAALALAALAFIWGCSDDDDNPTKWGSLEDPQFQAANTQFEALLDTTITQFTEALGAIQTLPANDDDPIHHGPGDPNGITDSLIVSYSSGWHTIHLEWHSQSGYIAIVNDSIQFLRNGQPTQEGSGLEQLLYRHRWSWTAPDTTVTYINGAGYSLFDFDGLHTQEATIDGANGCSVETKFVFADSVVHYDFAAEAALDDVVVTKTGPTWDRGCPTSGRFTATIMMTYQRNDEAPVPTQWNFSATFHNGAVHVVATANGYTWTYDGVACSQEG